MSIAGQVEGEDRAPHLLRTVERLHLVGGGGGVDAVDEQQRDALGGLVGVAGEPARGAVEEEERVR